MNTNAAKPNLSDIWETMDSIEGHDNDSGATSTIDKDQAVDQDTGKAWFDSYRITIGDDFYDSDKDIFHTSQEYWYTAAEMEAYARTW